MKPVRRGTAPSGLERVATGLTNWLNAISADDKKNSLQCYSRPERWDRARSYPAFQPAKSVLAGGSVGAALNAINPSVRLVLLVR